MSSLLPLPTLLGLQPRRFGLVSWSAHVAFAFDLVSDLRPRLLVELGTHSGESYFAFCQSVQENHTGTTCYAVDTWKGDPQAGFYPEEVFADVYRHNQEFYGDFSYLVRATFDEAVDRFVDGSVDLIHFDGLHTYEAVRHDLERWRPKLSPRGVALFHDIAARHDDFGAWKLWEEIRHEGQSFAFRHGWGLGIWKPPGGEPTGSPLLERLFNADETEAENIRRHYLLATETLRLKEAAAHRDRLEEKLKADHVQSEALREQLAQTAARCDEALRVQNVLRAEAEQRDAAMREQTAKHEQITREVSARCDEALRVQNVLRAEAEQRDAAMREQTTRHEQITREVSARCDEALRVQNVLRAEAEQRDAAMRDQATKHEQAMHEIATRCDEALRIQAALRAEIAHVEPVVVEAPSPARLQVYLSQNGVFDENQSQWFDLPPESWERITVALPAGWRGVVRLDPGSEFGLVEVAGVRVRTATMGTEVWKLLGHELAVAAKVGGSAQAIPTARTLRLLCTPPDPQIILPEMDFRDQDEPLTLEIGVRHRRDLAALSRSFQELAGAMAGWREIQARSRQGDLAQTELAALRTEHAAVLARHDETQTEAANLRRDADALAVVRGEFLQQQDQIADLQDQLADLRAEQAELVAEQKTAHQTADALTRETTGLLAELHAVHLRLADADRAWQETYQRLVEKDADLISANGRLEADHIRLRQMRQSFSWRATLPWRAFHRLVTGKTTATQRGLALSAAPPAPPAKVPTVPAARREAKHRFSLDEPTRWHLPAQRIRVRGWCLPPENSTEAVPRLRFLANGQPTDVVCDVPRQDVRVAHDGGHPEWLRCGFDAELTLPPGPSELVVEAVDAGERASTLARFSVRTPYAECAPLPSGDDPGHDYPSWLARYDAFSSQDRRRLRKEARALPYRPVISVVMPVYNAPEKWLVEAIESVRRQFYPYWELCIADDHSPQAHVQEVLRRYEQIDARVKVVYRQANGHISAASNSALEVATGEFIALLDHDDELAPHALYQVAKTLNERPGLRMIYSDEDKISPEGQRSDPYFKPDWNYDLFLGQNVFSHLGVYRRDLLNQIGGFTVGLEGSQDYDLALRCLERVKPQEIGHIPEVLYHWRMIPGSTSMHGDEKPYAREAARRAITGHLERLGTGATVEQHPQLADFHRVRRPLPAPAPPVAIIIPTRDGAEVLRTCVESVLRHTDYPDYRIVIVNNGSQQPTTFAYFRELEARLGKKFRVLDYPGEFNFSAINNFAVRETDAPVLCLLNNDIEAVEDGWLTEMVSQAERPGVGAVGARLLYPDGTLQHAGIVVGLGADRTAGHTHHRWPGKSFGYFGRATLIQQFSAVTAACMVVRRAVFEEVGGFDEVAFPVGLNDVDLCLRLRERGYVNVWTPFAELRHHESYSRGLPEPGSAAADRARREIETFRQRHWRYVLADPAYNVNLTLDHADFSFSVPPRGERFL